MILAAVFAAAVTILAAGMWVGWWMRGADNPPYWSDQRTMLDALAWIDNQGGTE